MLTLTKHSIADGAGAPYTCYLLLWPFKATQTSSIFNCLWEIAQLERPFCTLRPKKPKMLMSRLRCLARNDTGKASLLSLPPLYTHWWYFRGCQTEHYMEILFVRTWRVFFPLHNLVSTMCYTADTVLKRMEHRWFHDTSKLPATKRMSSLHFSFIPNHDNCLILLLRQFREQS